MNFHPVILAGGRGSRMYPLTEECPKALLPVGNKPLIWYPIQLLEKNGFEEAIVVVRESQQRAISDVLTSFQTMDSVHLKFTLAPINDQEDLGTADILRTIRHKIKSDVLLLSCDLVTSISLHLLTDFHSTHGCTLTALLVHPPKGEEPKKKPVINQRDIIGLTEHSKLVYFAAEADLDEHLEVSRSMLRRYPHIRVCSQLLDAHLYILQRWVLDYLAENKSISSVKGELVPHLIKHQSLQSELKYASTNREAMKTAAKSSLNSLEELAYQMSSYAGLKSEVNSKLVNCHAVVVSDKLCTRINTVSTYMDINRLLPNYLSEFGLERSISGSTTHTARVKGVSADSMVDSGVQLGEKGSVKRSCIGQHCSIGAKTKILNSVIMDHVYIGEGCSVQGCIICSHARIEDKVSLKDCQVGANFTVTREADLRGETLVTGGEMLF